MLNEAKKIKILWLSLILLVIIFSFSLFKNISYPLLWNDEAETAVFGQRILKFGYPKVDDGKNIVSGVILPEKNLVNNKFGAYVATGQMHFYLASLAEYFAKKIDNLYLKTAIIRFPFAVFGFLSLLIFAWMGANYFNNKLHKILYLNVFFIFIILSIPLVLHLREARYYSLLIFLTSLILLTYSNFHFLNRISYKTYFFLIVLFLFLLFNTFYPAYFIIFLTFFIHQLNFGFIKEFKEKRGLVNSLILFLKNTLPVLVSLILIIPLALLFKTTDFSQSFLYYYNNNYLINLIYIFEFFIKYEYLILALTLKVLLLIFSYLIGQSEIKKTTKIKFSNFLLLFILSYIFFIAISPFNFQRYYIVLIPIIFTMITLDIFSLFKIISFSQLNIYKKIKKLLVFIIIFVIIFNLIPKTNLINNHFYEIFHQYQGPLDYVIPYIKEGYKKPGGLTIFTNYEENSYIYYLNAKTFNNITNKLSQTPDIIIIRKCGGVNYSNYESLNNLLKQAAYEKMSFPIFDYCFNNIPEIGWHLFKTKKTTNEEEMLEIYVRQDKNDEI